MSSKQPKTRQPKHFNVPWEIKPRSLYLLHGGEAKPGQSPAGDLLAECTAAGRLAGHFRWAMKEGNATAGFRLRHLRDFGSSSPAFYLDLDMKPDEIELRQNSNSGKWSDLADWIAEDKLIVTSSGDETREDLLGKFLACFVSFNGKVLLFHPKIFILKILYSHHSSSGQNLSIQPIAKQKNFQSHVIACARG